MADCGEPATYPHLAHVRDILPRSASIIEAFSGTERDQPKQSILETANDLAAHHQRQWHTEDACHIPGASTEDLAAGKRLIDELNARRVALVEQIDEWVAGQLHDVVAHASLHTETLGSVIDRLAIAWVRVNNLMTAHDARDRARLALRQLAELADAYDDLIRDVAAGQRRLPAWRPLKTYRRHTVTTNADVPLSVSINGMDNVGKTTQLSWLHRGMSGAHLVGTIDGWDSRWRDVAAGDFAHWWFVGSTTVEHVNLMLGSHIARRAASGSLALEDRGLPMLRAACAATAVLKDRLSPTEALRLVDHLTADLLTAAPRREMHVLLRRSDDPVREAAEALHREPNPVDERYASYQHTLAEILTLQVERGEYHSVLNIGDARILDVQRKLRTCLSETGIHVQPLPDDALDRLWVLGGMSESGKSTFGELLRDEHGVTRLKIGYLLEVATLRAGITDPYESWSEREQAERLTEEILRFAETTKSRTISLESAHRFEATEHLKHVWGDRCQIVYVDADAAVRATRATEPETRLRSRDATKSERGADRIADIADHVIDNSGSMSALKLTANRVVSTVDMPRMELHASGPATQSGWLGRATDHVRDDQVALVLATGSTGTGSWRDGWSDLDLLVVRDSAPAAWLRDTVGTLPTLDAIKSAVSVFTTADVDAMRVPPRVVQSLRRAAQGFGVLYRREGYLLPVPVSAHGDRTSRGELGLVVMTTRRLLAAGEPDVRAVHKHLVLLAKILLRADGHDFYDAEDVLTALRELHPAAGCAPPELDDLIRHPRDPALCRQLFDAADRLLTYLDRLDHTVRTSQ
jgi:hypothetical protein